MAAKEPSADELYRAVSRQIGVPEADLRTFAKRQGIDPVALYRNKVMTMRWKERHAGRAMFAGRTAVMQGAVAPRPEEISR